MLAIQCTEEETIFLVLISCQGRKTHINYPPGSASNPPISCFTRLPRQRQSHCGPVSGLYRMSDHFAHGAEKMKGPRKSGCQGVCWHLNWSAFQTGSSKMNANVSHCLCRGMGPRTPSCRDNGSGVSQNDPSPLELVGEEGWLVLARGLKRWGGLWSAEGILEHGEKRSGVSELGEESELSSGTSMTACAGGHAPAAHGAAWLPLLQHADHQHKSTPLCPVGPPPKLTGKPAESEPPAS